MTTIIKNVNLNLVSNTTLSGYRSLVIASGVSLLACYAVHIHHYSLSLVLSSSYLSQSLGNRIDYLV
jgi:hypothetical protein